MHINITNRTTLSAAMATALFGSAFSSVGQASVTSSNTLSFTLGTVSPDAGGCTYGTVPPCNNKSYNISDIVGSYFSMDTNSNGVEPSEKTPIQSLNGIIIGATQAATGSHTGPVSGAEGANIDAPWTFFGGTGMHQTTFPITALTQTANGATLDMSGWNVTWNGTPSIPLIETSVPTMSCTAGSSCSDTSSYTLDASFHVSGAGFTSVAYTLHLEGTVSAPAATPIVCGAGTLSTPNCGDGVCTAAEVAAIPPGIPADSGFNPVGTNFYDFECQNTGTLAGGTIDVALTLGGPITNTTGVEYRKFNGTIWDTYPGAIETGDSATSGGNCDIVTTTWVPGINLGHDCTKVTLTDNDAFDLNGTAGFIADPGYLAIAVAAPPAPNLTSSTNGCSLSRTPASPLQGGAWVVLAGFAGLLACKRNKRQR